MMSGKSKILKRAICMGAVSYLALTLDISSTAYAQTAQPQQSTLPAVTVDAPQPQAKRRAATRPSSPASSTSRSVTRNRVAAQDQIAAQQAQSMNEALRYTPGVITELYGASSVSNDVKIRGFLAPRYLDGLRLPVAPIVAFAQTRIEPWNLERIEVLKGPSSGLYGETSPGGLGNMVSKRPTPFRQDQIEVQTGSDGRAQGAFDFSGPIDQNKEFLYRIVGLGRLSDTPIDFNSENRTFIAPSFTWQPTKDTSFTVLASYTRDRLKGQPQQYVPAYGTLYPSPLGRIPYNRYLGTPNFDRTNGESAMVGYTFEHRFNDMFQFRQNLRLADVKSDVLSLRNETGDPSASGGVILRSGNLVHAQSQSITLDNQLQADFLTGPLQHKDLFGVDYLQAKSSAFYYYSGFVLYGVPIGTLYTLNAYNPVYGLVNPDPSTFTPSMNQKSDQSQVGVYLQDEIKFDRFTLALTGRHDNWQADTTNYLAAGNPVIHQNNDAWTGRAGLSYLFDNGLAPYVSYSTSFEPIVGFSRSGSLKPTSGEGKEIGIKFKPPGVNALNTLAALESTQQNVLTAD